MKTRITFTGDLLAYHSLIKRSKRGSKYDFSGVFAKVSPLFQKSDYVVGNLETPLAGGKAGFTLMDMLFNTPDEFALAAKEAGFDMFTTANNHCMDKGEIGLKRTIDVLDKYEIDHTGTFKTNNERRYLIKEINGIKYAFLSFTYGTNPNVNGYELNQSNEHLVNITKKSDKPYHRPFLKQQLVNLLYRFPLSIQNLIHPIYPLHNYLDNVDKSEITNPENEPYINDLRKMILSAKHEADIVIVCLHAGGQFNSELGEYTTYLIKEIRECHVDALIVNHPHCVLGSRWNDNYFEAYSLGNFCFTPDEGYFIDGVWGEYGIVLHLDYESTTKKLSDVSFSIIKNERKQNGLVEVIPVSEIFDNATPETQRQLTNDVNHVISRFMGRIIKNDSIESHYNYSQFLKQ